MQREDYKDDQTSSIYSNTSKGLHVQHVYKDDMIPIYTPLVRQQDMQKLDLSTQQCYNQLLQAYACVPLIGYVGAKPFNTPIYESLLRHISVIPLHPCITTFNPSSYFRQDLQKRGRGGNPETMLEEPSCNISLLQGLSTTPKYPSSRKCRHTKQQLRVRMERKATGS